jgi:hypothetical protein
MNDCDLELERPVRTAEEARTRVGITLSLLELAAQVLEKVPPPETALPVGDRELFRYLQAAEAARVWLVGHEEGDAVDRTRTYAWDGEETERHFLAALRDGSQRQ